MNANLPPSGPPPPAGSPGTAGPKKSRWLLYGCGSLLGLLLVIFATVAFTIWYLQRPLKPVVLSPSEKSVVDAKLERVNAAPGSGQAGTQADRGTAPAERPAASTSVDRNAAPRQRDSAVIQLDPVYEPGGKVLRLTEREVNGLLNANTDLGNTVRLEFARDAIHAYVVAPIPEDVPVMGGKMFRARGRFRLALTNGAPPVAVLEDLTVFGLSLPNAWLGGIKGENLLADAIGRPNGGPALRGVKSLRIEPGALVLEVDD